MTFRLHYVTLFICFAFSFIVPAGSHAEKQPLQELSFEHTPFMLGTKKNPVPVVKLHCSWTGKAAEGSVQVKAGQTTLTSSVSIKPGKNILNVKAPDVKEKKKAEAAVTIGGFTKKASFDLHPTRRFEIFVVQHTHTDIGYTADQPQILKEHMRFIDEALGCIEATRDYPPAARFKWVCEVSWGTELFLDNRPVKAVNTFKRAASKGLIELTALPLNMTDVATEEVIIRNLQPVRRFRREGFEVVSAMQNDVNGFPWALPRLLQDIGVRYFSNGINETRSKVPFTFPCALRWESPDGSSLLTWRGPHYMGGNFFGLDRDLKTAEKKLGGYLKALADQNYRHDHFLLPISGLRTDNSPPTILVCDLIKSWNQKWTYPHLKTSTLKEYFTVLEKEEKDRIPRYRKAWCDWWADGIGAGADELALVKKSQESLAVSDILFSVSGFGCGPGGAKFRNKLSRAYKTALLFDEHTYGAYNSISDPGSLRAKHGWLYKSSFSASLALQSAELENAASSALLWDIPTGDDPALVVFNPLPWKRTCSLRFKVPRSIVERMRPFRFISNRNGKELTCQKAGEETLWIHLTARIRDLPPCGYRTWRIVEGKPEAPQNGSFTFHNRNSLDNGIIKVTVDPETGALSTLSVKGNNLTAGETSRQPYGFGRYIYEQIEKPMGRQLLWPRGKNASFHRRTLKNISVAPGKKGPVAASLMVKGEIEEGHRVVFEIILWKDAAWAELEYIIRKPGTLKPEGVYIAFPWKKTLMPLRAEVLGSLMEPGADQIPKSASDWHSIQNFILAGKRENGPLGICVTCDAPLVQFGGLNMGRYRDLVKVEHPLFYSWPMNNYWFTNFPAEQKGEFVFRYYAGAVSSETEGYRFSKERIFRPRASVLPRHRKGALPAHECSFLKGDTTLQAIKPAEDGNGLIVRLRNLLPEKKQASVRFSDRINIKNIQPVTILETPEQKKFTFKNRRLNVALKPYEACDFRIVVK